MDLTFSKRKVESLIAYTEEARKCRVPYTGEDYGTPEDNRPGLLLVGDEGVYLASNRVVDSGEKDPRPIAYSNESNPEIMEFGEWWSAKKASFGSSDGIEFIPLEEAKDWLATQGSKTLAIRIDEYGFSLLRRKSGAHKVLLFGHNLLRLLDDTGLWDLRSLPRAVVYVGCRSGLIDEVVEPVSGFEFATRLPIGPVANLAFQAGGKLMDNMQDLLAFKGGSFERFSCDLLRLLEEERSKYVRMRRKRGRASSDKKLAKT